MCQVLAVVEDQNRLGLIESLADQFDERFEGLIAKAKTGGDLLDEEVPICKRCQLDNMHDTPVRLQCPRQLQRHTRFSNPTRAQDRHHPGGSYGARELRELLFATDEPAQLSGQQLLGPIARAAKHVLTPFSNHPRYSEPFATPLSIP